MKINLNIEADNPAELRDALRQLGQLSAGDAPAPAKAATGKAATAKSDTPSQSAASTSETAGEKSTTSTTATSTATPAATTASSAAPADGATVSDADMLAAVNEAVKKAGNGGPAKVKEYIAKNYQKDDGTPGTLKLVKADQKPALLAGLQAIARGEITL